MEPIVHANTTHEVVQVDAELASHWLQFNTENRSMKRGTIEAFVSDIRAGRWKFDGAPIRFSKTGRLLDGQHRLAALSRCPGITLPFLVIRGLEDDTQQVMDQGAKRSAQDQLEMLGVSSPGVVAPFVRLVLTQQNGLMFSDTHRKRSITTPMVEQFVINNPDVIAWAEDRVKQAKKVPAMPRVALFCWWMCFKVDPAGSDAYFLSLMTGADMGTTDPALVVRNYLLNAQVTRRRLTERQQIELIFRGFNARRGGRTWRGKIGIQNYDETNFPWPA